MRIIWRKSKFQYERQAQCNICKFLYIDVHAHVQVSSNFDKCCIPGELGRSGQDHVSEGIQQPCQPQMYMTHRGHSLPSLQPLYQDQPTIDHREGPDLAHQQGEQYS